MIGKGAIFRLRVWMHPPFPRLPGRARLFPLFPGPRPAGPKGGNCIF